MTDFLLELRCEEIPARMQDGARDNLAKLFAAELAKAGLAATETVTYATPRRLALIARGLPDATQAVSEELKGPPADAPDAAIDGFLRKAGLTRDALETRDVKGRATLFAVIEKPGRATAEVIAEAIPAVIRAFPWPKSMRWGAASLSTESLRWVRPLHGIVALLGDEVVPVEIAGVTGASSGKVGTGFPSDDAIIKSTAATLGHRFQHPGAITIGSAADYVEKLRACHVIVDQDERRAIVREHAAALAAEAGLELIADEGLVAENAGLIEWPVPLLGRFDPAFLDVPPEVIQLTARVNQKYFVCRSADGKLANAFVCTANIDAADGGAKIVEGNRKVLAARLADARFFYETDLKVKLDEQARKLEKIVFHEKLGTVAAKVERVAKLARWLVESEIVTPAKAGVSSEDAEQESREMPASAGMTKEALADLAERAARLAKADLVTGMVGEFPELQGLMGGYYAAAQGEPREVADAIRDHYKPVGQGDEVPTAPVTVAVSLADKLDTLALFFAGRMPPSGSKDPFALRRAAIGIISIITLNRIRASIIALFGASLIFARNLRVVSDNTEDFGTTFQQSSNPFWPIRPELAKELGLFFYQRRVANFLLDRLKVQQREAGVRHDLIDAVFALGGEDDLVRLLARVRALQSFVGTEDGANLLAGYKRAANILKKEGGVPDGAGTNPSPDPAEGALIAALDAAEPAAAAAIAREDFEGAMAALATLRAPIDAFFDGVTVNDADATKRAARLALLDRVRAAVHAVADFSKIEG